jgi:uncharacterized protein (DUF2267 family)
MRRRDHDAPHLEALVLRAASQLPGWRPRDIEKLLSDVLAVLAGRLGPRGAGALAAELPSSLAKVVRAHASHAELNDASGGEEAGDRFLEELATRRDIDDDEAEELARACLTALRSFLDERTRASEILEAMPSDLERLFVPR